MVTGGLGLDDLACVHAYAGFLAQATWGCFADLGQVCLLVVSLNFLFFSSARLNSIVTAYELFPVSGLPYWC